MQRQFERGVPLLVWQVLLGIFILAGWQAMASLGFLDKFFFSRPSDVLGRIGQWIWTGSIWPHLLVTLEEAVLSFVFGVIAGILFGFLLARVPFYPAC